MKFAGLITASMTTLFLAGCMDPAKPGARPGNDAAPLQRPLPFHPEFKTAVGKVLEGYFRIQGSLAQDDLPEAMEAFSSMHAVLHMMPSAGLEPSAKAYWDSTEGAIMRALHPMAAAVSLDSVRPYFTVFSVILAEVVETVGLEAGRSVYRFHCPMANLRQGADWMQEHRKPRNPYFGRSMPECGDLIGTREG